MFVFVSVCWKTGTHDTDEFDAAVASSPDLVFRTLSESSTRDLDCVYSRNDASIRSTAPAGDNRDDQAATVLNKQYSNVASGNQPLINSAHSDAAQTGASVPVQGKDGEATCVRAPMALMAPNGGGEAAGGEDADAVSTDPHMALAAAPIPAYLNVGDVLFFDTRVYHFGGKNGTQRISFLFGCLQLAKHHSCFVACKSQRIVFV